MANKLLQQLVQKRVLSKTKASLKAATPVVEDPTLQTWIKEVSSTVKEIASTGVRKNDLVKAGIATISNGELQNALQPDEEINLTVPDAVINLEASGAYSSITLTWETRPSKYFGMNIIYRSEIDDFGTATQIGSTMGDVYTDYVGNNIKAYYWVRTVSSFGVEGKLAPSVSAETAIDVAYVMEQITGQINASHLNELLQSDLEAIHQLQADLVAEAQARIADILQKATELNNLADLLSKEAEAKVGAVTADLNQKAADLNNRVTDVKTEVTEMIESVDDKVDSLGTAIQTDIDALDDGLTQEIQKRIDGDSTITTALNAYKQSNDNAVAVVLEKAETAISANSATASDVTALQTRMTTAEGSIANKADATAFNLLSTEVTKVKNDVRVNSSDITSLTANLETVTDTADTALSTASSAKTTAESAVTKNTALSQRVDSLAAAITDLGEGAETNVDVYAFNALKAEVTSQGGDIDANTQNITSIGSRLTTAEGKVTGNTTAINNLKTTQTTQGNTITQAVEDITALENSIETIESNVSKKADATTVTSLSNQVTEQAGKIKTTSDSLTQLTNKVGVVEGNLAKKVDSTALVNYYTKTEVEDKALTTAAGEVSKYDATLEIGGTNLQENADFKSTSLNRWTGVYGNVTKVAGGIQYKGTSVNGAARFHKTLVGVEVDKTYTLSVWAKSPVPLEFRSPVDATAVKATRPEIHDPTVFQKYTYTFVPSVVTGAVLRAYIPNIALTDVVIISKEKLELGSKGTDWSPSPSDVQSSLDANATAIQTTNTEVGKVADKTTANSNAITGLTSRLGTVEGQVSTKAEASALQNYYTKSEADTKATTIAAGEVSKYDASLIIGGTNLIPNSDFTDGYVVAVSSNRLSQYTNNSVAGTPIIRAESTASANLGVIPPSKYRTVKVEAGKQYTISMLFASSSGALNYLYLMNPSDTANQSIPYAGSVSTDPAKPTRVTITFTPNKSSDGSFIMVANRVQPVGAWLEVSELQLEEGTKATSWKPSFKDTQQALDANATAIVNTNAEVTRVDGRVTATNSSVTALTGRVSRVEGDVATKADVSAVNALTTRVGNVEGGLATQASNTTRLTASLDAKNGASLIPDYYMANHEEWESHYGYDLSSQFTTTAQGNIGRNIFFKRNAPTPSPNNNWNYSKTRLPNNKKYKLSMLVRGAVGAEGSHYFTGRTFDAQGNAISYLSYGVTSQAPANGAWRLVTAVIDWTSNEARSIAFGFAVGHTGDSSKGWWMVQGFSVQEVITADVIDDSVATSAALSSTNTEVTRINGVVKGHTEDLKSLTSTISGKADSSALSALTTRVSDEEKKSSSQAISITDLTASLSDTDKIAKNALPQVTGGSNFKSFKDVLSYYLATSSNANNIVIETPITFNARMFKIMISGFNYVNTKSVLECSVSGYAYSGTSFVNTSATDLGTFSTRIRLGVKDGKVCVILSPKGTNWSYPQFSVSANIGHTTPPDSWKDGWSAVIKTEAELATYGVTAIVEPSILDVSGEIQASAGAVSTLDAKVDEVDGRVTSQASQITTLTTDNNNNKNALSIQAKVLNGVKASYMVKMETNGVIGGFGMVQETGALGNVTTSFGVNADTFFIGSPSSKKKPFAVLGSSGSINGVTVPAGTYIDTAYIPDGTITNAKIGNLSADKITAGNIAADRMKANIVAAAQGQFTTLSALSAKIGVLRTATSGARTEIKDNLIEVYDSSGKLRVRLGVW